MRLPAWMFAIQKDNKGKKLRTQVKTKASFDAVCLLKKKLLLAIKYLNKKEMPELYLYFYFLYLYL